MADFREHLGRGDRKPVRITSAAPSAEQERRHRERRYLFSMGVRVLCFIGAVAVGPGALRWVLVAGAVLLPWIAVVMANTTSPRTDDFQLQDVPENRPELGSGSLPTGDPDLPPPS